MNGAVRRELERRGYRVNDEAYAIIEACDDWYRAKETEAHRRVTLNGVHYSLIRTGFGRRLVSDEANMCEVVEINPGGRAYDAVNAVLRENRFGVEYRKLLELTAAEGTAACYVRMDGADVWSDGSVRGGRIALGYVPAGQFLPLSVENGVVTEAAFIGTECRATEESTVLVLCTRDADGVYRYETMAFDKRGAEIAQRHSAIRLGKVRPFAVLKTADVNTFECMRGFGYPKLYNAIPLLAALDAAFTALTGDIETAEKITLINEHLCRFDDDGVPLTPGEQMKRRFVMLGEKLPGENEMVHEITPEIRVEQFRETIDMLLEMLSRQFGFGSRRYTLDGGSQRVTATQYTGERLTMLQELNRQRFAAKEFIGDLVMAIEWFSNAFLGTAFDIGAGVEVEFDDSCITDRAGLLEAMRQDVLDGIGGEYVRVEYLKRRYNLSDEEAAEWAKASPEMKGTEQ